MKIHTLAFGGAVALASMLGTTSAFAFTHHPATPEEIQQTDALNAQALANAHGTSTNTTLSGSATAPAVSANTDTNANGDATTNGTTANGAANGSVPTPDTTAPAQPAPSTTP